MAKKPASPAKAGNVRKAKDRKTELPMQRLAKTNQAIEERRKLFGGGSKNG